MMVRLPEAKSCFLSLSTENVPKPADLARLLVSLHPMFHCDQLLELKELD